MPDSRMKERLPSGEPPAYGGADQGQSKCGHDRPMAENMCGEIAETILCHDRQ